MPDRLILCSRSPRRQEMLRGLGYTFEVDAADIEERPRLETSRLSHSERCHRAAQKVAEKKVEAVLDRRSRAGEVYLAADTLVVIGEDILEKPADDRDARRMLHLLEGKTHQVITGFALRRGDSDSRWETSSVLTDVRIRRLTPGEIADYVATGEPFGKAGGYAIQGAGGAIVSSISGSHSNVIGLPLAEVARCLTELTDLVAHPALAAKGIARG